MKKRLISFCLALVFVMGLIPAGALGADVVAEGYCGAEFQEKKVTWTLDNENTLTICGTGAMADYYCDSSSKDRANSDNLPPWESYRFIKRVVIEPGITHIGAGAFWTKNYIEEISIPDTVTSIGASAFRGLQSYLKTITIPDSVRSIGDYAFVSCGKLTSVRLGTGLTYLGQYAFQYCVALKQIRVPAGVKRLRQGTFSQCKELESVQLDGVRSIEEDAFLSCKKLKRVKLPNTLERIEEYAFLSCESLVTLNLPSSLREIGYNAFGSCKALTGVVIPEKVTELSERLFANCTSLSRITLPGGLETIQGAAFENCSSLTDVYFLGHRFMWEKVRKIEDFNEPLLDARLHCYPGGGDREALYPAATGVFEGHRYALYTEPVDYWAARDFAVEHNGYLTALTTAEEEAFAEELLGSTGVSDCWIGLRCDSKSPRLDSWVHSEGKVKDHYTNWGEGQPVRGEGRKGKLGWDGGWHWEAEQEETALAFLCEWDDADIVVTYMWNDAENLLDDHNWTPYEVQTVTSEDGIVSPPDPPVKEGYTFKGWYQNSACKGEAWDFKNDPVATPMTLYAKWKRHTDHFVFETDTVRYRNDSNGLGNTYVWEHTPQKLFSSMLDECSGPITYSAKNQDVKRIANQQALNGLCFGTCALMALDYYDLIDLQSLGYRKITDITNPQNDSRMMTLLCSLYVLQVSDQVLKNMDKTPRFALYFQSFSNQYSESRLWKKTIDLLSEKKPVLLTLLFHDHIGHHEVIAYDCYQTDSKYFIEVADPYDLKTPEKRRFVLNDKYEYLQYQYLSSITGGYKMVTNDSSSDLGAIMYDFSPLTQYDIAHVCEASSSVFLQDADTTSLQDTGEAGTWLMTDYPDFTVKSAAGTAAVKDFVLEESPVLTLDGTGAYTLADSDSGWTVTPGPGLAAETVQTDFVLSPDGTEYTELDVEAAPAVTVSLAADGLLSVSGAARISATAWNADTVGDNLTTLTATVSGPFTARAGDRSLTLAADGALGAVTVTVSDLWNDQSETVTVEGNTLEIAFTDGQLALTYDGRKETVPRTHSVVYNTAGGTAVAPVTGLADGDPIPVPDVPPVYMGYRFDGWSYTDGAEDPVRAGDTIQGENVTVYALWTRCSDREIRFTVGTDSQTVRVKYNSLLAGDVIPTAESFGLEGEIAWDKDALAKLEGRITEDVTVMGTVEPKADGQEVSVPQVDIEEGAVVQNNSSENLTLTLIAAYYNQNGQLLRAAPEPLTLPAKQSQIVPLNAPAEAASVKVMLLRTGDFVPLCESFADIRQGVA